MGGVGGAPAAFTDAAFGPGPAAPTFGYKLRFEAVLWSRVQKH
jgi:hypothetical protein